ncbi:hypothetical protein H0H93_002222, partial [Arthromyces matolae]
DGDEDEDENEETRPLLLDEPTKIQTIVEDELDELLAIRQREELEEAYGIPVINKRSSPRVRLDTSPFTSVPPFTYIPAFTFTFTLSLSYADPDPPFRPPASLDPTISAGTTAHPSHSSKSRRPCSSVYG